LAGPDSQEDDEAAKIELTYSTPDDINRARLASGTLAVCIIQVLPTELVVSDDGSTDATMATLETFRQSAPFPVRIYQSSQQLGPADNFLRAAGLSGGNFLAFCDQDDVWDPDKLRIQMDFLAERNVDLVVHPAKEVDRTLRPLGVWEPNIRRTFVITRHERRAREDIFHPSALGCTMLMRERVLLELLTRWPSEHLQCSREGRCRGVLGHDSVTLVIAKGLGGVGYIALPLVWHRRHESNTCRASIWGLLRTNTAETVRSTLSVGSERYSRMPSLRS